MQPTVTPEDQIVKAVGNLTLALRQRINACGQEEMEVLERMNEILNNAKPKDVEKKRDTFKDPIPEPTVGWPGGDLQQPPRKILTPREETAIIDKPLSTVAYKGPTT